MRAINKHKTFLYVLGSGLTILGILLVRWKTTEIQAQANSADRPVLVELFTSEGCSSCPPADALLSQLDARQPISGAHVIVLSEHVTYWNEGGWRDPFSSEEMTDRQARYVRHFGLDSSYTPQAVVDGAWQLVGSDSRKMVADLKLALASPKVELSTQNAQWSGDTVKFSLHSEATSATAVTAVLAEDSAQTTVLRGENGGRTLQHVAVVRALKEMSPNTQDGRPLSLKMPASSSSAIRLVVFATDKNGHVIALNEQTLRR